MLAAAVLLFTPTVAANDFLIQDDAENPLFLVNGTSGHVGIGTVDPAFQLAVAGQTSFSGNITLNDNNISQVNELQDFFAADKCTGSEVVAEVFANGSYKCTDIETYDDFDANTDNQNLSHVLEQGNVANQSINMSGNNLVLSNGYLSNDGDSEGIRVADDGRIGLGEVPDVSGRQVQIGGSLRVRDSIELSHNNRNSIKFLASGHDIKISGGSTFDSADTGKFKIQHPNPTSFEIYRDGVVRLRVNESVAVKNGNLNMSSNKIINLADPSGAQDAATKSYVDNNDDTGTDNQNLSEVLVVGNVANRTINMDSNDIIDVNVLDVETALTAGNISLGSGLQDSSGSVAVQADAGISVSGSGVAVDWASADALTGEGAISSFGNASDLFANGNVTWRSAADLDGDGGISDNVVDNAALDNSGSFTFDDLTLDGSSGTLLTVEGDAQVQGDLDVWGNVTNTQVNEVSVNGSLLPPAEYNDTFNLGNSSAWWKDAYLGGDLVIDGLVDGVDVDQPGTGLEVSGQALQIAADGVGARELDDTGNFDVNSINIATALDAGNISLGDGLQDSSGSVAVETVDSTITVGTDGIDVGSNEIDTSELAVAAVTADQLAVKVVNTTHITDGTVLEEDLSTTGSATDGQFLTYDSGSGGFTWVSDPNTDDQNLSEVLAQGNVANDTINMDGNDIDNGGTINASTLQQSGTDIDGQYVNEDGDNMTGNLNMTDNDITDTKRVDFGNGNELVRSGNDLCLGDQCNG
jgi:hypothetical protein